MVWPPHQASKDARTPKAEEITIIQSRIEYSPTMSKYNEFSKAIMKTPPTLDESIVIYIFYMTNVYYVGTTKVKIKECYHIKKKISKDKNIIADSLERIALCFTTTILLLSCPK